MLPRLIIALLLIVAAIIFVRHLRAGLQQRPRTVLQAKTVRCEHCQVYLPRADAVERAGHHYCSVEHADLHAEEPLNKS